MKKKIAKREKCPEKISDGSGSEFFGFGLRSGFSFRVRVLSGFTAKKVSGLIGFGFNSEINFRVRV